MGRGELQTLITKYEHTGPIYQEYPSTTKNYLMHSSISTLPSVSLCFLSFPISQLSCLVSPVSSVSHRGTICRLRLPTAHGAGEARQDDWCHFVPPCLSVCLIACRSVCLIVCVSVCPPACLSGRSHEQTGSYGPGKLPGIESLRTFLQCVLDNLSSCWWTWAFTFGICWSHVCKVYVLHKKKIDDS